MQQPAFSGIGGETLEVSSSLPHSGCPRPQL
nr:MAG TPA: hypothetical protein [Caudoviricetes sp.]